MLMACNHDASYTVSRPLPGAVNGIWKGMQGRPLSQQQPPCAGSFTARCE